MSIRFRLCQMLTGNRDNVSWHGCWKNHLETKLPSSWSHHRYRQDQPWNRSPSCMCSILYTDFPEDYMEHRLSLTRFHSALVEAAGLLEAPVVAPPAIAKEVMQSSFVMIPTMMSGSHAGGLQSTYPINKKSVEDLNYALIAVSPRNIVMLKASRTDATRKAFFQAPALGCQWNALTELGLILWRDRYVPYLEVKLICIDMRRNLADTCSFQMISRCSLTMETPTFSSNKRASLPNSEDVVGTCMDVTEWMDSGLDFLFVLSWKWIWDVVVKVGYCDAIMFKFRVKS